MTIIDSDDNINKVFVTTTTTKGLAFPCNIRKQGRDSYDNGFILL